MSTRRIKLSNGQIIEVPPGVKIINSSSSASSNSLSDSSSDDSSSSADSVKESKPSKPKSNLSGAYKNQPKTKKPAKEAKVKEVKVKKEANKTPSLVQSRRFIYGNLTDDEKSKVLKAFKNASGKRQEKIDQVNEQFGISKYMIAKIVAMDKRSI